MKLPQSAPTRNCERLSSAVPGELLNPESQKASEAEGLFGTCFIVQSGTGQIVRRAADALLSHQGGAFAEAEGIDIRPIQHMATVPWFGLINAILVDDEGIAPAAGRKCRFTACKKA